MRRASDGAGVRGEAPYSCPAPFALAMRYHTNTRRTIMTYSRREMALLAGALATRALAQSPKPMLTSKTYVFEDLPVKVNGLNKGRKVLEGSTHGGFAIESHITELAPGQMPHAPHHHLHEEIM